MASCQRQSTELDRTACFSILALTIVDEIEGKVINTDSIESGL